jgi:hypothetical protein
MSITIVDGRERAAYDSAIALVASSESRVKY